MNIQDGWIGVDLDGTLAFYDKYRGVEHIGTPIPEMVNRIKQWLNTGRVVKIFTARACDTDKTADELKRSLEVIDAWCLEVFGETLPITCKKDRYMMELWDDRCIQVQRNTGVPCISTNNRNDVFV